MPLKFHKYAELFPLLEGEEFAELVEDVKENGLLEPIWLFEDKIIDGRNRYLACLDAKVKPEFREYTGDDAISFVISENIRRRHLSASQKAMLGAALMPILQAEAGKRHGSGGPGRAIPLNLAGLVGDARDQAAKRVGISHAYVDRAVAIVERAPEIAEIVRAGKIPLGPAFEIATGSENAAIREGIAREVIKERHSAAQTKALVAQRLGKIVPHTARQQKELEGIVAWEYGYAELRKLVPTMTLGMVEKILKTIEGHKNYEGIVQMLNHRKGELTDVSGRR